MFKRLIAGLLAGVACGVSAFSLATFAAETVDNVSVRLTPEQTLALYGTTLTARRFEADTTSQFNDIDVQFTYAGVTSDWVGSGAYGQNIPVLGVTGVSSNNQAYYKTLLQSAPYLVYTYDIHNNSFYSGLRFSFNLQPRLSGITNYDGNFLFSVGGYQYPYQQLQKSTALFTTTAGIKSFDTLLGTNYMATIQTYNSPVPAFGQTSNDNVLSCTFTTMYAENAVYFANERYNLENIALSWKSAGGITTSAVTGGSTKVYLLIQCPEIWNYTPPAVTTAATTRREYSVLPPQSTAPAYTADLSNLESGVAAIVEQGVEANNNLEWIGSNVYIGVNNLAHICNTLDSIYAEMQRQGAIPINGTFMDDLNNVLTSYTTARIPEDAAAGLTLFAKISEFFMEWPWIADLAFLGLALAVTYFVLFRGRNS